MEYDLPMNLLKKVGVTFIILLFFYLNVDSLCTTLNLRFKPIFSGSDSLLPNHWTTRQLFRIWDVFDRWSIYNSGFRAYGSLKELEAAPAKPTPEMIDLNIYSYFPYERGDTNRRLGMPSIRNNPSAVRIYQKRILEMVKKKYNQEHPEAPIQQAFLYLYVWEKSPEGQDFNMDKGEITLEVAG